MLLLVEFRTEIIYKQFNKMEMRGFEPRTSYMQSKRSTTELHPLEHQ